MERYTAGLFELVARLRLSDVHFTGHIEFDQLVALYRLADVYLSLSAHEGFGVPLLEAFYLGLPVAALASGAVEETMNGGGALVRAKDPLRTAALLDRIVSDTDFKARLVASGRRALEKYSPENIGRILAEHLRRAGAA
jgi:glycosyltransferase involved in cell wall biosynthesis